MKWPYVAVHHRRCIESRNQPRQCEVAFTPTVGWAHLTQHRTLLGPKLNRRAMTCTVRKMGPMPELEPNYRVRLNTFS